MAFFASSMAVSAVFTSASSSFSRFSRIIFSAWYRMTSRRLRASTSSIRRRSSSECDSASTRIFSASRFVLGADVQDSVRVDVKSDFDLRRPARGWWNSIQLEFAKRAVVVRKFAFALHDVNFHARLVVRRRGVSLHLARRDRSVARNLHGHYSAQSFHAQRERS